MLAIYNESNHAWGIKSLSKFVGSLYTERIVNKNNESATKRTDVIISKDLGELNLESYVNMTDAATVYENKTNVKFQQKDERAIIGVGDKYNTDVIVFTLALNGRIVKDFERTPNVNCLNYLIAGGELSAIVSVKETNNPADATTFNIVLHDNKSKTDTTYTFSKVGNKYTVYAASRVADEVIDRPTFKFIAYRPARVTRLVFVAYNDSSAFNETYTDKRATNIVRGFSTDTDIDDLDSVIKASQNDKFRAVTVFVNADEETVSRKDFGEYNDIINTVKANFRVVNVLLNNGHIIKL